LAKWIDRFINHLLKKFVVVMAHGIIIHSWLDLINSLAPTAIHRLQLVQFINSVDLIYQFIGSTWSNSETISTKLAKINTVKPIGFLLISKPHC
jgi:hypothetical protein